MAKELKKGTEVRGVNAASNRGTGKVKKVFKNFGNTYVTVKWDRGIEETVWFTDIEPV